MTSEERAARREQFLKDVEATRARVRPRLCSKCRGPGAYSGMIKVADNVYQVALRCSAGHFWSVKTGTLEAHAMRPKAPCEGKPMEKHPPDRVRYESMMRYVCMDCLDEFQGPLEMKTPCAHGLKVGCALCPKEPALPPSSEPSSLGFQPVVASLPAPVPGPGAVPTPLPVNRCGLCGEPTGAKYYAGTPTKQGKLDLCMRCWEDWQREQHKPKQKGKRR